VIEFHAHLEANILAVRDSLKNGCYEWGRYRSFWVIDPKLRQIESAPFRDRVVHQAMAEIMEPLFDPTFYHHSYACRSGRGTHKAMHTLHRWTRQNPDFHFLQMDVAKYFPSINRAILLRLIESRIGDPRFLHLTRSLLNSSPSPRGIPIGNLTSQVFANLYLDRLDQFIKRVLRVKLYLRYMDDIVLLHRDRAQLEHWRGEIERFAQAELALRFHPHKVECSRARAGISFVGYRISPRQIRIKNKSLRRFRARVRENITLDQKVRRLLSYNAHLRHAHGHISLMHDLRKRAFSQEGFMAL
jgi:RNA-directed DNA polymerase